MWYVVSAENGKEAPLSPGAGVQRYVPRYLRTHGVCGHECMALHTLTHPHPPPTPWKRNRIYCHRHRMTNWPPEARWKLAPKK